MDGNAKFEANSCSLPRPEACCRKSRSATREALSRWTEEATKSMQDFKACSNEGLNEDAGTVDMPLFAKDPSSLEACC